MDEVPIYLSEITIRIVTKSLKRKTVVQTMKFQMVYKERFENPNEDKFLCKKIYRLAFGDKKDKNFDIINIKNIKQIGTGINENGI